MSACKDILLSFRESVKLINCKYCFYRWRVSKEVTRRRR